MDRDWDGVGSVAPVHPIFDPPSQAQSTRMDQLRLGTGAYPRAKEKNVSLP